jgi:phosphopentomutase
LAEDAKLYKADKNGRYCMGGICMENRVIWIVLDSVGMGELPDAKRFGDEGSNTLGNIARDTTLSLPNMRRLGLGNIEGMKGIEPVEEPVGCYGRLAEQSDGKDTTTGHWDDGNLCITAFSHISRWISREYFRAF